MPPISGQNIVGNVGGPDMVGISVSDAAGVERVLLGQISSAPDYGLKVVSSDGSTVIIDGNSNMFKIQATGTMSQAAGPGTGVSTGTVTLTGITASTTPAHLSFVSTGNATTSYQSIGGVAYNPSLGTSNLFAASSSGGSPTVDFAGAVLLAAITLALTGSNPIVTFHVQSFLGSFTFYGRYYVLQEAAL